MGYWDELEIFRCADGCQELAKRDDHGNLAKGRQDLAEHHGQGSSTSAKDDVTADMGSCPTVESPTRAPDRVEPFDFVIFAIPPSVWHGVTIRENDKKIDPTVEIGEIGMAPAVKFFSDVKETASG